MKNDDLDHGGLYPASRSFCTNQLRDRQATRTTSEMLKAMQEREDWLFRNRYILHHITYVTNHFFSVGLKNPFRFIEKNQPQNLIRLSTKHVSFNFC